MASEPPQTTDLEFISLFGGIVNPKSPEKIKSRPKTWPFDLLQEDRIAGRDLGPLRKALSTFRGRSDRKVDIDVNLLEENFASVAISNVHDYRSGQSITIYDLPAEIMMCIFTIFKDEDEDDMCTATCLGLTCRKFYPIFKSFYPSPVRLYKASALLLVAPGTSLCRLKQAEVPRRLGLLDDFMQPHYRPNRFGESPRRYLSVAIYGERSSLREFELHERYSDYCNFFWFHQTYPRFSDPDDDDAPYSMPFPCPTNLGESWYDEALKVVEVDFPGFENKSRPHIWKRACRALRKTFFHWRLSEQKALEAWGEWIEQVGF